MNYAKIACAGMVVGAGLSINVASASAPAECTAGPELRSYEAAYKTQARYLEKLFQSSYGCRLLESFSDKVAELTLGLSTTDPCRAAGNRDAGSDTIDKVTKECLGGARPVTEVAAASSGLHVAIEPEGECARNGREEGKLRAEIYCKPPCPGCYELPSEEIPLCDRLAAQYCKQAFRAYVNSNDACRARALSDARYNDVVEAACAPPG